MIKLNYLARKLIIETRYHCEEGIDETWLGNSSQIFHRTVGNGLELAWNVFSNLNNSSFLSVSIQAIGLSLKSFHFFNLELIVVPLAKNLVKFFPASITIMSMIGRLCERGFPAFRCFRRRRCVLASLRLSGRSIRCKWAHEWNNRVWIGDNNENALSFRSMMVLLVSYLCPFITSKYSDRQVKYSGEYSSYAVHCLKVNNCIKRAQCP